MRRNFFRPFILTFFIVVVAGISAFATFQWIVEPAKSRNNNHFQLSDERVVNGTNVTEEA